MNSTVSSRPYIDDDGKTDAETYFEAVLDGSIVACQRIIKLAKRILPEMRNGYRIWRYDPDYALKPVRFIEKFCKLGEGKKAGQPFILEPYERAIIETAFGFVDEDGNRRFQEVIVQIARKNGKDLTIDTEIATPVGWRRIGDIHPGDYVIAQDGTPSKVLVESEIFTDHEMYLVTFEDGSSLKAGADHIWTVQTKHSRRIANYVPSSGKRARKSAKYRDGGWYETTTQEMFDDPSFTRRRNDNKGTEYKYRVPMCLPVEYPEKDLPIDPYTFGCWIGDGSMRNPYITSHISDLDNLVDMLEKNGHTWMVRRDHDDTYTVIVDYGERPNPFRKTLETMGVFGDKHIPDMYLQGSVEQRWELLRGLMDTDGYCSKAGQCQFTQKNERVARAFVELCSSLGIKANFHNDKIAKCNGKECGVVCIVEFWTDKSHSCFHLKRKHDRLKDKLADRMKCKSIVSIERIPTEPSKCIAIDNPTHLYLAGRHYTATHNTELCAALNIYMLMKAGERGAEIYNVATTTEQASLCMGKTEAMIKANDLLDSRIRKGKIAKRKVIGLNYDATNSYLCTLSAKGSTKDGLNPFFAVMDELGACRDHGEMYDQITEALGAREEPMVSIISTENRVRQNIWDERKKYATDWLDGTIEDDRLLAFMYD